MTAGDAVTTGDTIERFGAAMNRQDATAVAALLSDDTVFENTSPAPDGQRIVGGAAVAAFWREWFARNPGATFETEETIVSGNRATVRWVYRKLRDDRPWHLRGVDVFTVRDGKIAEKLSYVKS
jgi:ketosteroid isomerase-like protein